MSSISRRRKINVLRRARVLFVEGVCTSERAVDFQETEAFKCLNHCWKYTCKFFEVLLENISPVSSGLVQVQW